MAEESRIICDGCGRPFIPLNPTSEAKEYVKDEFGIIFTNDDEFGTVCGNCSSRIEFWLKNTPEGQKALSDYLELQRQRLA